MGYIDTVKAIAIRNKFADRDWFYEFKEIPECFDEVTCKKRWMDLSSNYSKLTNNWTSEKNSEWLCRIYMSAKMILSSTLTLQSLEFSDVKNLRVVIPYLEYYSVLSAMRSLIFTLPNENWSDGNILNMNHSKIINLTCDYISRFDIELSQKIKKKISILKAQRELISYKAPTSGDFNINKNIDVENICRLLVEIAQFNSEILEASIHKNSSQNNFKFDTNYISKLIKISIENTDFLDLEDSYRLDYLRRKWPVPTNILHIMTEGHTEDFFGVWDHDDDNDDIFSPGSPSDWQLIFDIP